MEIGVGFFGRGDCDRYWAGDRSMDVECEPTGTRVDLSVQKNLVADSNESVGSCGFTERVLSDSKLHPREH